jgi:hypothetical protein
MFLNGEIFSEKESKEFQTTSKFCGMNRRDAQHAAARGLRYAPPVRHVTLCEQNENKPKNTQMDITCGGIGWRTFPFK